LTTANPETDHDRELFRRLGIKPLVMVSETTQCEGFQSEADDGTALYGRACRG
jgi:hypothetical protein